MTSDVKVLPATIRKYVVAKLSTNFREAVELITVPRPTPGPDQILIRNRFLGINASDINCNAARYEPSAIPPIDCGFEGVGEVVEVGNNCKRTTVGQSVGYIRASDSCRIVHMSLQSSTLACLNCHYYYYYYIAFGAFSDYILVSENGVFPLPECKSIYLPLLVSGLTAAISLDKCGVIQPRETVLVTAAAGGTGQFAVQWARNAGCHVIGTCSSDDKVEFLCKIGCHRPINYKKENLKDVLRSEYPKGVNVVYESVGGETFETCLDSLAVGGRLVVIGFISGYQNPAGVLPLKIQTHALVAKLLTKSASIRGFFIFYHATDYLEYAGKLIQLMNEGKLISTVDNGINSTSGKFCQLESIPDAVDYLHTQKNIGKIVVELVDDSKS